MLTFKSFKEVWDKHLSQAFSIHWQIECHWRSSEFRKMYFL